MKRILSLACLAVLLPVLAQAQTANPSAKVDPKNNKVSRPVVEKPKPVLLSRDQLRTCLVQQEKNEKEAQDIKAAQATNAAERNSIQADKAALVEVAKQIGEDAKNILAERDALMSLRNDLEDPKKAEEMGRKERQALLDDFKAKAAALDVRIEAHNKSKGEYQGRANKFDARIDPFNKATKDLEERTEAHLDAVDEWKKQCGNKSYDEADEKAVRKELAAQQGK